MNYTKKIFERANIQKIREFLIEGIENDEPSTKTYDERLQTAEKKIYKTLKEEFKDEKKLEDITDEILCDYSGEIQNVHMEIGLQCGFALAVQMLSNITITVNSEQ